jgi:hypothetical protein
MLTYAIIFILFLPVALLAAPLENLFSRDELDEMGVRLDHQADITPCERRSRSPEACWERSSYSIFPSDSFLRKPFETRRERLETKA